MVACLLALGTRKRGLTKFRDRHGPAFPICPGVLRSRAVPGYARVHAVLEASGAQVGDFFYPVGVVVREKVCAAELQKGLPCCLSLQLDDPAFSVGGYGRGIKRSVDPWAPVICRCCRWLFCRR
jgi:hypothetical protein